MTNQEAIKWIKEHHSTDLDGCKDSDAMNMAIKALEQQRNGMWYIRPDGAMDECYCSICGHGFDLDKLKMMWEHYELPPHCPACGVKMEGNE